MELISKRLQETKTWKWPRFQKDEWICKCFVILSASAERPSLSRPRKMDKHFELASASHGISAILSICPDYGRKVPRALRLVLWAGLQVRSEREKSWRGGRHSDTDIYLHRRDEWGTWHTEYNYRNRKGFTNILLPHLPRLSTKEFTQTARVAYNAERSGENTNN